MCSYCRVQRILINLRVDTRNQFESPSRLGWEAVSRRRRGYGHAELWPSVGNEQFPGSWSGSWSVPIRHTQKKDADETVVAATSPTVSKRFSREFGCALRRTVFRSPPSRFLLLSWQQPFLDFQQRSDLAFVWKVLGEKQILGGRHQETTSPGRLEIGGCYLMVRDRLQGQTKTQFQDPRGNRGRGI
jgi:hypothetical protein